MLYAEKEANLIKDFQDLGTSNICLVSETMDVEQIVSSILDLKNWKGWIDASSKDNVPPPDFYNDELGLMMEVMRVDDHGFKKKGKVVNPTYDREHQIERELRDAGILDMFPNAEVVINADSGLPTKQDHNFKYYFDNFKRTVENHIKKIPKYRANHPNHKLIFFIYDESSAYFEAACEVLEQYIVAPGKPHLFMVDKAFVEVFQKADIDYVIWFTPFKRVKCLEEDFSLPKACVYKAGEPLPAEYTYNVEKMVSMDK